MNTLLLACLLGATITLASFHHLDARGEKYCDAPTGQVMCFPHETCGTGPNFGKCCPEYYGPCTTHGGGAPPSTTTSEEPSPTACFDGSGYDPSDWICCNGPGGVYRCDHSSVCGVRPVFGLCCPIYSRVSCSEPTGGITPTLAPTASSGGRLNPRGEKYCDGPNGEILCYPMDKCGKGENFGLCCPIGTDGPCTPPWSGSSSTPALTTMPITEPLYPTEA